MWPNESARGCYGRKKGGGGNRNSDVVVIIGSGMRTGWMAGNDSILLERGWDSAAAAQHS